MAQPVIELPAFDQLKAMANENPEALEQLRNRLVSEVIERAPTHQRAQLEGLQFVLDMERRRAKNPMQCCIRMSQLMHERVERLRQCLKDTMQSDGFSLPETNREESQSAMILNFPKGSQDVPPKS
jgi:DNA polymerase II small subunit/DNA polymerase delta subunit B